MGFFIFERFDIYSLKFDSMKKIYLFLSLLILFASNATAQIPNSGYETWTNNVIGEDLDSLFTSNLRFWAEGLPANVQKVPGNSLIGFAAKLETKTVNGEKIPGIVSNFNPINLGSFPNIPGGRAFNQTPDSIVLDLAYNVTPSDSAIIMVIFKNSSSGFPPILTISRVGGIQNSFRRHAFKLNPLPYTPDTMQILIASGNLIFAPGLVTGNWVSVDNIQFVSNSGTSSSANFDLENWTPIGYEAPLNWNTSQIVGALFNINSAFKANQSFAGTYALGLKTNLLNVGGTVDTIPGIATTAQNLFSDNGVIDGGFPYNGSFIKVHGFYRYQPVANDSASVAIWFKNNGVRGDSFIIKLPAADVYTEFSLPFFITGSVDSANLVISSSNLDNDAIGFGVGSELWIDGLSFSNSGLNKQDVKLSNIKVYPNPARNNFVILEGLSEPQIVYLFSIDGKLLKSEKVIDGKFNLPALSKGTYILANENFVIKFLVD